LSIPLSQIWRLERPKIFGPGRKSQARTAKCATIGTKAHMWPIGKQSRSMPCLIGAIAHRLA